MNIITSEERTKFEFEIDFAKPIYIMYLVMVFKFKTILQQFV